MTNDNKETIPVLDFTDLKIKGDLISPGDAEYESATKRWAKCAEKPAGLVAFVKDEHDVSEVIKWATKRQVELAIKGGGHNPSGASSTAGGVVIDLSRYVNQVTVDPEARIAYVGGGALLRDVDQAAMKHGLATVVGTVGHTGIGGLVLGGGYGWLSGEHGLAIDNLVGATIVIADGAILDVSKDLYPDLLWAIKGAGSNFGVVTKFKLSLHPQIENVFMSELIFEPRHLKDVFKVCDELRSELKPASDMVIAFISGSAGPGIAVTMFYNGTYEEGKAFFQKLYDIGAERDNTSLMNYIKINRQWDDTQSHGKNCYMSAHNLHPQRSLSSIAPFLWDEYMEMILNHPELSGSIVELSLNFSDNIIKLGEKGEASFNSRGRHTRCQIMLRWPAENDGRSVVEWKVVRTWAKRIGRIIDGQGQMVVKAAPYSNEESDPIMPEEKVQRLFGDNYRRLQVIKAKYDPNLIFCKWFPIKPDASALDE